MFQVSKSKPLVDPKLMRETSHRTKVLKALRRAPADATQLRAKTKLTAPRSADGAAVPHPDERHRKTSMKWALRNLDDALQIHEQGFMRMRQLAAAIEVREETIPQTFEDLVREEIDSELDLLRHEEELFNSRR